ncbi:MAG: hypothetical protein JXC31_02910 [Acholeplasmataceae bacterium]|nr:hypothetical protein [Acholeplasmataceae bacterium]
MSDTVKGFLVILFLAMLVIIPNIKFVQNNKAYIVERLGKFLKIIDQPGIYFLIPLVDRVIQVVPLDINQKVITFKKENSAEIKEMTIKYKIENVKIFVYASLDSFHTLKEYIETLDDIYTDLTDEQKNEITIRARQLGIEIIEICK